MSSPPQPDVLEATVTAEAEMEKVPGTVLDGKFRIKRLLGAGGMGAVYEIEHELTRHRRAMKLLHAHLAGRKRVVDRFLREASAAGRIGNPHIVETFDAGRLETGEPYLVMEFLEGKSLRDRLDEVKGEGLQLEEAVSIMSQVCNGVQAAHAAGIVHRDLKPDNIFLCVGEPGWFVKVLDFGISKFDERHSVSSQVTAAGALVGTPAYMSPEQFEDAATIDARTDVYALGVILWESLAGEHPYPSRSLVQLAKAVATVQVPPIRDRRPELPGAVDGLLAQALRKEWSQRTITAQRLGLQLAALSDEPDRVQIQIDDIAAAEDRTVSHEEAVSAPPPPRGLLWPVVGVGLVVGAAGAAVGITLAMDSAPVSTPSAIATASEAPVVSATASLPEQSAKPTATGTASVVTKAVRPGTKAPPSAAPTHSALAGEDEYDD